METKLTKQSLPSDKHRYWQGHVASWQKNGLNQKNYRKQKNISSDRCSYWKNKFLHKTKTSQSVKKRLLRVKSMLPVQYLT